MNKGEEIASKLCEMVFKQQNKMSFKEIDKFFPYTNEDIRDYSEVFDYNNKNVLTVCGSGDQVFNSIILGAKEVTTFDINIVALYHFELKKAIIEFYSVNDFIRFYKNGMDINMYKKVRDKLSTDCLSFWDALYRNNTNMFRYFWGTVSQTYMDYIRQYNVYLDDDKYELLKEKLKTVPIKSFQKDIFDLNDILNNKFDIMNFSNILNVLKGNMNDTNIRNSMINSLKWYKEIINKYFSNSLNENGRILVNYYFSPFLYNSIASNEIEKWFIENSNFSIFEFSVYGSMDGGFSLFDNQHILLYKNIQHKN